MPPRRITERPTTAATGLPPLTTVDRARGVDFGWEKRAAVCAIRLGFIVGFHEALEGFWNFVDGDHFADGFSDVDFVRVNEVECGGGKYGPHRIPGSRGS